MTPLCRHIQNGRRKVIQAVSVYLLPIIDQPSSADQYTLSPLTADPPITKQEGHQRGGLVGDRPQRPTTPTRGKNSTPGGRSALPVGIGTTLGAPAAAGRRCCRVRRGWVPVLSCRVRRGSAPLTRVPSPDGTAPPVSGLSAPVRPAPPASPCTAARRVCSGTGVFERCRHSLGRPTPSALQDDMG